MLAGENGCGKTTLLEAVFAALAPSDLLWALAVGQPRWTLAPAKYRVVLEPDDGFPAIKAIRPPPVNSAPRPRFAVEFEGAPVVQGSDARSHGVLDLPSSSAASMSRGDLARAVGRDRACFYSEANVTYAVPAIQSSTALAGDAAPVHPDAHIRFPIRGGVNLAAQVAQLLVDVQAADNADTALWAKQNPGQPVPEDVVERRMRRFTRAFHSMFPAKRVVGVEQSAGEYQVVFEEHGRRTTLAELSTGEKQIVFRGAFLLRQLDALRGAVVLIDEPELSLHPRWQERIAGFYEEIVADEEGFPSQVILATHSPFVVHGSPEAAHVVLRRDAATGRVERSPAPSYPGVTLADTAVHAFHAHVLARAARAGPLVLATEGPTDEQLLRLAWGALHPGRDMPFELVPMGGAQNLSGHLRQNDGRGSEVLRRFGRPGAPLVGLFDFDNKGFGQWNGAIPTKDAEVEWADEAACLARKRRGAPVWGMLLPVPPHRGSCASKAMGSDSILAVELLFHDTDVGDLLTEASVPGLDPSVKRRLAPESATGKALIEAKARTLPPASFEPFRPIFEALGRIASHR